MHCFVITMWLGQGKYINTVSIGTSPRPWWHSSEGGSTPARHVLGGGKWLQGFLRLRPSHPAVGVQMWPHSTLQCCQAPPATQHCCWPVVSASSAAPSQRLELSSSLNPTSQPSLPDSFQTSSFVLSPMLPLMQKLDFFWISAVWPDYFSCPSSPSFLIVSTEKLAEFSYISHADW